MNSLSLFEGSPSDDNRPGSSTSGSEDGSSYAIYSDTSKTETDPEDESSGSLTSQTLNADGTPKRPMNAFMIFARRRRPQVSAENQSMRTGEISKILSKEWNNMPAIDKQFYLDQAKQLKDTFNSKYPDYVYRRRPNNSRKRRRGDIGSSRHADLAQTSDGGEEVAPLGDPGDASNREGEDSQVNATSESELSHAMSESYGDHGSHSYVPYRQDTIPFAHSDRLPNHLMSDPPRPHSNPNYTYLHANQTPTHSSVYNEQQQQQPENSWDARFAQLRSIGSNWLGAASQHNHRPSITTALSGLRTPSFSSASTSTPSSSWPSSASTGGVTSASTDPPTSTYSSFSTLTSPFYPQSMSNVTSPEFTSPINSLAGQFGASRPFGTAPDSRNYAAMSPPPQQYPPSSRRESAHLFNHHLAQRNSFSGGVSGLPRSMPPQASFSGIPLESSHNSAVPQISGYWARDKIEGH